MTFNGRIFGIVGALSAFPRRLAARQVAAEGGLLRRGITRKTTDLVFGRTLLEQGAPAVIEARIDAAHAAGQKTLSEAEFLRQLGLVEGPVASAMSTQALLDQSGLTARQLMLLSLFDAFEHGGEPYSFRDTILARKYAGLIAGGADWLAIARSVHRVGALASLTALSLQVKDGEAIYARRGDGLSELDGQTLLPFEATAEPDVEDLFAAAKFSDDRQDFETAAGFYRRCLAADPGDSVVAYNLANSLKAAGAADEAGAAYMLAIKLDPGLVEAWFNLAALLKEGGRIEAARRHLEAAIAIDADYSDAIYNLAALDYETGDLFAARRGWTRYLELDQNSAWAKTAARGIQFVDIQLKTRQSAG